MQWCLPHSKGSGPPKGQRCRQRQSGPGGPVTRFLVSTMPRVLRPAAHVHQRMSNDIYGATFIEEAR
jgi:hypothetical protein